ncbi:MAG TPA: type II toxin-antitoxin system HigB family toxin [Steroidobacteraceae bacterium]|nr:type II toxin-antitoxin system HigB family toxin [Steroidobacteraceae bacterium]
MVYPLLVRAQGQPGGIQHEGNDYRLIAVVQYSNGVLMIRFFGSRADYDRIDAETVQ